VGNNLKKGSSENKIRYLNHNEFENLLNIQKNLRDELIISLLYEIGCTVNELVNIKNKNFDFDQNLLKIQGKSARNKEQRYVYLSDKIISSIKKFQKANLNSDFLFFSRQSPTMTTKRIRQIVQKYLKTIGIEKAGPQILRYTHIVHAYQKKIPLDAIQKQVGLKRSRAIEIFGQLPELNTKNPYKKFTE
jgi:site-specific recombinase XerD